MRFHPGTFQTDLIQSVEAALLAVVVMLLLFTGSANAQQTTYQNPPMPERHIDNITKSGDVGLGIMLGTPVAANVKFWTAETRAFNTSVAYDAGDVALMGDYEWHFRQAFAKNFGPRIGPDGKPIPNTETRLPAPFVPYIGIGALVVFNTAGGDTANRPLWNRTNEEGPGFGGRIPIGLEYLPQNFRTGFFAELAPGAIFTPNNFTFLQGDVGARVYF